MASNGLHDREALEYVGFWARVGASLIDTVLLLLIITPLLVSIYGWGYFADESIFAAGTADFLISWVLPAVVTVMFWAYKRATPGKMAVSAQIVDARTGEAASTGQLIGRYLGYFVSTIPLMLGFIWVAFDERKQGWHDKLAGTVVIRPANRSPRPVVFDR